MANCETKNSMNRTVKPLTILFSVDIVIPQDKLKFFQSFDKKLYYLTFIYIIEFLDNFEVSQISLTCATLLLKLIN